MEWLWALFDFIIHIDRHLDVITRDYGSWTYGILFLIVFCETGLVVTPLLPGDSLLFAAGAIAARGNMDVNFLFLLLCVAAIFGDAVNYYIGYRLGPAVLKDNQSRIFKREYLEKTERFYAKYGSKTIVIARFVPIVRTFAPFLAGVGRMRYRKFAIYNVVGGISWVAIFLYAGFFFGELPVIKNNFPFVILGIIVVSILPMVYEYFRSVRSARVLDQVG